MDRHFNIQNMLRMSQLEVKLWSKMMNGNLTSILYIGPDFQIPQF